MDYQPALAALALLLFLGALASWAMSRRMRTATGLPTRARIVYSDTDGWKRPEKPLFSSRYRLAGKPDYIVEIGGTKIPIEVKPGRRASEPRSSDILQLAAYGLLIEEELGAAPAYGLLRYGTTTFEIRFDQELRARLTSILEEMRQCSNAPNVARDHQDARRCRGCGFREVCGEALQE